MSSPRPDPEGADGPFSGSPTFMRLWRVVKDCSLGPSGATDLPRQVCLRAQVAQRYCLWVSGDRGNWHPSFRYLHIGFGLDSPTPGIEAFLWSDSHLWAQAWKRDRGWMDY